MTTNDINPALRPAASVNRFTAFADLTSGEAAALERIAGDHLVYSRDQVIRHEGDRPDLFLLREGWVTSSAGFDDGSRQVVKIYLPGDMMGLPSLPYTAAADTLTALTEVSTCRIAPEAISKFFTDLPRLAMLCFLVAQEERIILMERLMSIGRRRGAQRLAAFLLHIHDRLCLLDPSRSPSFELPLTLEQIGDVLGLHAVHVSRTFTRLERLGLIHRDHKRIDLLDFRELRKQAGLPERIILRNAAWLPSATAG